MTWRYDPSRVTERAVIDDLLTRTVPETLYAAVDTPATLRVVGDRDHPIGELVERIVRRAEGLVAAGFAPGDRLGVWLPNGAEFVVWAYAAIFAGGSSVFIPARAPLAEARRLGAAGAVRWTVGHSPGDGIMVDDDAERLVRGRAQLPTTSPGAEAACYTTSGSTGTPKLAALSHRSWAAQVVNGQAASGGTADESVLHLLPMCHSAFLPNVHANLVHGRTVVHLPEFDAREALRVAAENRTAYVSCAPTMLGLMLQRGDWPNPDLRFRRISYGSAPMPAPWASEIKSRFGCAEVVHGYGLTEAGGWAIVQDPHHAAQHDGSVGRLMPGHDALTVLLPDGSPAGPGEEGELCLRGRGRMLGYVGLPEETAETLRGGWLHTGDLARVDSAGEVWITGRIKDQINRAGLKIGAREVESVIEELPGVTGVAVVAVSDPVLGERVGAMVESETVDSARVRAHVAEALADYKVPTSVAIVSEMPRNGLGKPDKPAIRRIVESLDG